jgi:glycosyltransferase involved in cell wall biosynthesis
MLTVLSVGYSLAAVGPDAVGGSEQVLSALDAALVRAGHRSLVVAPHGSSVQGTVFTTPKLPSSLDDDARRVAQRRMARAITDVLQRHSVDLVHMHGLDFHQYLPAAGVPVLATLHLPPDWYPDWIFSLQRPQTYLHCVSQSQASTCPRAAQLLPVIENGVPVDRLKAKHAKRAFALALARICPEKGVHCALEAARIADVPMIVAGQLFPYAWHERYFEEEVAPRLDLRRRFIGPIGFTRKRRLLSAAQCLLVPSLVPETSSLVTMEALACGTPVIGFPAGALPEIIEHGKTGFIVENEREMALAIRETAKLDPEACREAARTRFSLERTIQRYFELYEKLVALAQATGTAVANAEQAVVHGRSASQAV